MKPKKQTPSIPKARKIVGLHAVNEAIKVRAQSLQELWLMKGRKESPELLELIERAEKNKLQVKEVSKELLNQIASHHQGVATFSHETPELDEAQLDKEEPQVLLALDQISDPQNLGALLRTAWLMGVQGVLISESRSAPLTPIVHKVACGGAEHVPVEVHTNLPRAIEVIKEKGFWAYGMKAEAQQSLYQVDLPEKVLWVIGSEGKGIRKPVAKVCDDWVKIDQIMDGPSYNASVSAAMALYETFRNRNIKEALWEGGSRCKIPPSSR